MLGILWWTLRRFPLICCILTHGMSSFWKFSMEGLWMVLRMHVMMMMGKSISQPSWVNSGCSRAYLLSCVWLHCVNLCVGYLRVCFYNMRVNGGMCRFGMTGIGCIRGICLVWGNVFYKIVTKIFIIADLCNLCIFNPWGVP